jgi:hypothetical protein
MPQTSPVRPQPHRSKEELEEQNWLELVAHVLTHLPAELVPDGARARAELCFNVAVRQLPKDFACNEEQRDRIEKYFSSSILAAINTLDAAAKAPVN